MNSMTLSGDARQLVPAFRLNGNAFVWACSHCRRLFFADIAEAESQCIGRHILLEFGCHFCSLPQPQVEASSEGKVLEISYLPNADPMKPS